MTLRLSDDSDKGYSALFVKKNKTKKKILGFQRSAAVDVALKLIPPLNFVL